MIIDNGKWHVYVANSADVIDLVRDVIKVEENVESGKILHQTALSTVPVNTAFIPMLTT